MNFTSQQHFQETLRCADGRGGGHSIDQLRAAGKRRAQQFTRDYQQENGRRRARQATFLTHNRHVAPDGFRAQNAYMRGPSGLRLLSPEHIQFLRPEQLCGPGGKVLSAPEQRLYFGLHVWQAIWRFLAPTPDPPSNEEFLAHAVCVQERLEHGLPLESPLDVIYAAPNDFCDPAGQPWSSRKQRKLFRAALLAGRAAAEAQILQAQQEYHAKRLAQPRKVGQRRPLDSAAIHRPQPGTPS